ncbi:MAG: NAD-dependent epimerase/dehydratase family protein [Candidatus Nanopelagicales bacterium]|jgi:nucleoside-diphosphate-sugar epimerase
MPERIVITGGGGVVGGAVARVLVREGCDVVSLQRGTISDALRSMGVSELRADITGDVDDLTAAFRGADAVVHAAARVDIVGPWEEYERINIAGTAAVVDAARAAGVGRLVMVSSPSVAHAGRALVGAPAGAADPTAARGNYARSKAAAELLALDANSDDMAVVVVRPHLVWGPGDSQLTERIIERARSGRLVTIGSGAALIDTTYIDNAGDAIAAAAHRAAVPSVRGRAFVVSNGEPRTVLEMLTRIARAGGAAGPSREVPYAVARAGGRVVEEWWERTGRAGEPPVTSFLAEQLATAHWFDQREVRTALQWSPRVSIDEGFARLSAHYGG